MQPSAGCWDWSTQGLTLNLLLNLQPAWLYLSFSIWETEFSKHGF